MYINTCKRAVMLYVFRSELDGKGAIGEASAHTHTHTCIPPLFRCRCSVAAPMRMSFQRILAAAISFVVATEKQNIVHSANIGTRYVRVRTCRLHTRASVCLCVRVRRAMLDLFGVVFCQNFV